MKAKELIRLLAIAEDGDANVMFKFDADDKTGFNISDVYELNSRNVFIIGE